MKKYNEIIQGSPEWFQKRKGAVSGTVLSAVMGTPKARQEQMYDTIAERLTVGVDDGDYENPRDRGIRLEDAAIAMFELEKGIPVEKTGYVEHDENSFIGYSPDGLIGDTEDIEVKCPLGKNYVKAWLKNEVPSEYYWQVVQAFIVNPKLQKRYFVLYHPDIDVHPLHIIEVDRSVLLEDIEKAKTAQEQFLKEVDEQLSKLIEL